MPYGKRKRPSGKPRYARRARTNPSKKGLSKTETKQVKKIAEKTVNSMAESKYFDTNFVQAETPSVAWNDLTSGDKSEVSVYAFSTGYNRQILPSSTETNVYGQSISTGANVNITNLRMNKVYQSNAAHEPFRLFAPDGQTLRPSFNECKWNLNYFAQDTTSDYTNGLAYCIRMVRVRPRMLKASFSQVDPENDLFLDQHNQDYGIQTYDTDASMFLFGRDDFYLAKVNSRKYQVIEDKFMNLMPPGVYNSLDGSTFVTQTHANSNKTFRTTHDLGKELFYPESNDNTSTRNAYPSTGQVPELIFFHVIAIGNNVANSQPQHMHIAARPVSTFKDM